MTQAGAGRNAGTGAEPLPQFLAALSGAELDVDGEMVADALWLAQFVTVEAVEAEVDEVATGAERDGERGAQMRPEQRREPEPEAKEPEVEVVPQDGEPEQEETSGTGGAAGKVFQAPRAKALRQGRALGRALRPLKRRVRSANKQVLDEAATAERTAERRFCLPVMEAAPERWLEVALVVEEAPSMFLWRRTVQEFGQLLERQGAFRDVRIWRLKADDAGEYRLYAQGHGNHLGRPRSARELVDPAGRRLILLVSDCTSGLWRSEQVKRFLEAWGKEGLFSIVQLLPERLWSRTMLGYGSLARLSGLVPGTANGALRAEPLVWVDEEAGELLKLPVVTLEPGAMGSWAKVLAGFGSSRTGGVLLDLDEYSASVEVLPRPQPGASAVQSVELTEAEALAVVKQFLLGASSRLVGQLAGYMAAVPVSPPITDLIRETLLPGATQAHVAEVYMSGLMRRVRQLGEDAGAIDAEATGAEIGEDASVQYEFIPAVRRVLVRTILASQTEQVLEAVSRYLIERHGLAVANFLALLRWAQEEGAETVDEEVGAFARFGVETLRQMGPRYSQLVEATHPLNSEHQGLNPLNDFDALKKMFNAFNSFRPLESGDPAYVNCQPVRGYEDIRVELGQNILFSDQTTCQLYTGHRGTGKSTELFRLKRHLEANGYRVVYFAADEADLDVEDTQYTDILWACMRNLLKALRGPTQNTLQTWFVSRSQELKDLLDSDIQLENLSIDAQISAFSKLTSQNNATQNDTARNWFVSRSQELKDLLGSDIQLENLSIEQQISAFTKLTATVKASTQTRAKIRQMVEAHAVSLLEALNEFIAAAMAETDQRDTSRLVLIVDNLDRIVPVISGPESDGKSNHDRIFIDRSEQLKGLNCHVVYTVPISMVYSGRATDLRDNYGADPHVLPMVMVRRPNGEVYEPGMAAMKDVIRSRVFETAGVNNNWSLEEKIFESQEVLDNLCLMSGGHMRNLILMMQEATKWTAKLPIAKKAVLRAITETRSTYRNTVYERQWKVLAEVHQTKQVRNELAYRELFFNRCILEYWDEDEETGDLQAWYDVHPVMREIPEFRAATEAYLESQ